ncbi:MAG: rhodanese-like domain-containing protein [Gammaproteobacteria bacterium]|nr:rhodanese-like domain-containing protein [Gammaproteobacteria bacterium]
MKFAKLFSVVFLATYAMGALAAGVDPAGVPEKKRSKLGLYFTAQEAYDLVAKKPEKTLFVDVRSRAEVNFLGTPVAIDANIPYMEISEWYAWNEKSDSYKMEVNSEFSNLLAKRLAEKKLTKSDNIVLICRSGDRSARAADLLADLGYKNVYSVLEGFEGDMSKEGLRNVNGWKNANLPWSYKLAKAKMVTTAQN